MDDLPDQGRLNKPSKDSNSSESLNEKDLPDPYEFYELDPKEEKNLDQNKIQNEQTKISSFENPQSNEMSNEDSDTEDCDVTSDESNIENKNQNNRKNGKREKKHKTNKKKEITTVFGDKSEVEIPITNTFSQLTVPEHQKNASINNLCIKIHFHVYVPPEFNFDADNCKFGMIHNLSKWEKFIPMQIENFGQGYILNEIVPFTFQELRNHSKLEYKYVLEINHDGNKEHFYEYFPHNNRVVEFKNFEKEKICNIYDGIMMPPDDGNKNVWERISHFIYKKIIKNFYNDDLLTKYFIETINAMLYEIQYMTNDDERLSKIDLSLCYFSETYNAITKCFGRSNIGKIEENFLDQLFKTLMENNKITLASTISLIVFISVNCNTHVHSNLLNRLFDVLVNEQNIDVRNICSKNSESIFRQLDSSCLKLFSYPEIFYFCEFIIKLKLNENDISYSKFKQKDIIDLISFYSNKISVQNNEFATKVFELLRKRSSKILLNLAFKVFFVNHSIETNDLLNVYSIFDIILQLYYFYNQSSIVNFRFLETKSNFFLEIFEKLVEKFFNSNIENFQKEDLHFVGHICCEIIFNRRMIKPFASPQNLNVLLLIIKIYVSPKIFNLENEANEKIPNLIDKKLHEIYHMYKNELISSNYLILKDIKIVIKNWSILNEIIDVSNERIKIEVKKLLIFVCDDDLKKRNISELINICNHLVRKEIIGHSNVEKSLLDAIIFNIEKMTRNDINSIASLSKNDIKLFSNLVNEIIEKKWPADENKHEMFNFIFECSNFLKAFFLIESNIMGENDKFQEKITQIISLLDITLINLIEGEVYISLLFSLKDNQHILVELYRLFEPRLAKKIWENTNELESRINKTIEIRLKEVQVFNEFLKEMKELENYLKILNSNGRETNIDCKNLEFTNRNFQNLNDKFVSDLVECIIDIDSLSNDKKDVSKLIFSNIKNYGDTSKYDLERIKKFISLSKEFYYLTYFTYQNIDTIDKPIDLNTFLKKVIYEAENDFKSLCKSLNNGSLDLENFNNNLIFVHNNGKTEKIMNEEYAKEFMKMMKLVRMTENKSKFILKQLDHYLNLPKIKTICELLVQIRDKEELSGNFEPLIQIKNSLKENKNVIKRLIDIKERSMKLYEQLDKLSDENFVKCLEKYLQNYEFIEWLRENAPNLNSLKLLCEFASESENEGALGVVLVQSLSLVGTAFAPLIYDLRKEASYEQLVKHITQVYQIFSKNRNLPEKIEAIAKQKAWLEDIKDSKGNTEANSLKQVKRINQFGILDFGVNSQTKKDDLKLDDIMKLTVPKTDTEIQKSYTYSQLRDLQDKLTLVVGKDESQQEIIRYFEDVFESIILMGDIYLNLMNTGNILFKNWNATIYNNNKEPNTMKINFGLQNQSKNVFAVRKNEKITINSINKTIKFLKKCSDEWLLHIENKRNEFPNLNFFKINQIVELRVRLAEFMSSEMEFKNDLALKDLFDLLYNVNQSVDIKLLKEANEYALNKNLIEIKSETKDTEKIQDQMQDNSDCINELISYGFNKKLILLGIKELGVSNVDALINYCIDNDFKLETSPRKIDKNSPNSDQMISTIMTCVNENDDPYNESDRIDDLEQKFNNIYERFLEYLDLNFEDYVSLEHLGLVLEYLKKNSISTINRVKPPYLEYNIPNLIICPQDDIINRTLSIYSLTQHQPLPTNDEVLYCNSKTSSEEIELFWKRVLLAETENSVKREQKIYTLVNVQDLLYDQAVKAQSIYEKLISERKTDSDEKFLFCIICSSEKEDKSVFVTAFNRYRRNIRLIRNSNENLLDYLKQKFNNKKEDSLNEIEKDFLNVRVVTSDRAGVGKSLYIKRQIEKARLKIDANIEHCCISIKKKTLPFENVFEMFKNFEKKSFDSKKSLPKIFHIDIAYEVWYGVDYFLFNLLCLGIIENSNGKIYRRSSKDLYFIEIMSPKFKLKDDLNEDNLKPLHSVLTVIPSLTCINPVQVLSYITGSHQLPNYFCPILFDEIILNSAIIQRPCQYLKALDSNDNLDQFSYNQFENLNSKTCLELLLKHLENSNPSWSEIIHFASFLNSQLIDCEKSHFCNPTLTADILPGFKTFVVTFMVQMAHDFALPSLEISDRSVLQIKNQNAEFQLDQLKMRRKWETDPHPYLFFNPDGQTFTFFGFTVDTKSGLLLDSNSHKPLFQNSIRLNRNLINGIKIQNRQILNENIGNLSKLEKIHKLLSVMGIEWSTHGNVQISDPDPSYELTMDNLLKILAIYMRLRADIPVIIMGETGCGKTRLCKYMCELQKNPNERETIENMYLVKVHGGTSAQEIINHVEKAQDLARANSKRYPRMFTILFFDEANSTEAIGTIKEIMCDSRINGIELDKTCGLKIIAACNPYKKHAENIIQNFEKSGLGFYVEMNETQEKLGDLPMRHLVYRVQPLPASMLPIIWDFGTLDDDVEKLYIHQIVKEKFSQKKNQNEINLIVNVLFTSQKFMREQKNECSFVSLRDIQRVLKIINWFLTKAQTIYSQVKRKKGTNNQHMRLSTKSNEYSDNEYESLSENEDDERESNVIDYQESGNLISSIIFALNACYHVSLQSEDNRREYRNKISQCFPNNAIDENFILTEINNFYELFLDEFNLPDAIARNQALKENIFMMLICVELKIPLFIIGKPGSSKSLAKTLISQKLQGSDRNNSTILRTFKEAYLITFQCSPLSTSEMILNTFRYCAKYQYERRNDLDRYTSVVVLDEIGLAEASASMPLKTLHPLLEDGVHFDEKEEGQFVEKIDEKCLFNKNQNKDWQRIGFIGISNWVLDPAKMNRGIFVNRNIPSTAELEDTVKGICKNDSKVLEKLQTKRLIKSLSDGYLKLCEKARSKTREFFGLRDFYSLIKMIYWHLKESESNEIEWSFLERVIKRNFGGLVDLDPAFIFMMQFQVDKIDLSLSTNNINVIDLIKEALVKKTTEDENRYLLLLSQNDNALDLINNFVLNEVETSRNRNNSNVKVIFGSSFPNDQKYSQVCKKIHQIKLGMELGKTVILLNLENLYESLYDALNQFYYKFGENEKFVDLGLGTARIKCLVHQDFRLIVVADKKSVYNPKKYPIPLVNRLEKHLLSIDSILNEKMKRIVRHVEIWVNEITEISDKHGFGIRKISKKQTLKPSDVFIGFTEETISSLVYKLSKEKFAQQIMNNENDGDWLPASEEVENLVKILLLQSSTSDGIIRLFQETSLSKYTKISLDFIIETYYKIQAHENFSSFFHKYLFNKSSTIDTNFVQITTHSKLLSRKSLENLSGAKFQIESLLSFDSQQQFVQVLHEFYDSNLNPKTDSINPNVLIIQCDCGNFYQELVNCARFTIIDEYSKITCELNGKENFQKEKQFYVILIIQVPKIAGGCMSGFQTFKWFCYHIDNLQNNIHIGDVLSYKDKSLGEIFDETLKEKNKINFEMLINIIKSVIYNTCSKIIDNYSNLKMNKNKGIKNRSIERIEILLKILNDNKLRNKFSTILLKHMSSLQLERESILSTVQISKSWMLNEVSKISNVIKYATLKNSCQNYIESRVTHLLSGLISIIDTNNNLDLLVNSDKEWYSEFCYQLFDDGELLNLNYKNLYLQANNSEKHDFICSNNFNLIRNVQNDTNLKLKLPFSWIIKAYLDNLIRLNLNESQIIFSYSIDNLITDTKEKQQYLYEQLKNTFSQSLIRVKLEKFLTSSNNYRNEFITAYINDFILLAQNDCFINLDNFKLVKNRLFNYCKQYFCRLPNDLDMLMGIHCAYEILKKELKLFSKFAHLEPKCIDILIKNDINDSNLCFLAARYITGQYSKITVDMKQNEWEIWFKKVNKSSALIENFFEQFPDLKENNFEEFHSLWQKCTVVKLYIECLCYNNEILYNRCSIFWNLFSKNMVNFKNFETYKIFNRFIELIVGLMKKNLEKNSVRCEGCDSFECDFFYVTKHCENCFICMKCINELNIKQRCPKCGKKLSDNHIKDLGKVQARDNVYFRKLDLFQSNLNCLLMELIKTLCFNPLDKKLPDKEIIESIIDFMLPKSRNDSKNQLFDLNVSPSIKSTLFQLLLNYNEENINDHLLRIFIKSKEYLKDNYDQNDLISLKIMYLNSIEDSYYSRGTLNRTKDNFKLDIKLSLNFLKDLLKSYPGYDDEISKLKLIARIKFCLSTCSKLVVDFDENEPENLELINLTKIFLNNNKEILWFGFYFIKYIFRRHGKAELIKMFNRENTKDLIPFDLNDSNNIPNTFVVFGDEYMRIRNSIDEALINGNLNQTLKDNQSSRNNIVYYFLALYERVTLVDGFIESENQKCTQLLEELKKFFGSQKEQFEMLFKKHQLPMGPNTQNIDLNIQMLLMHFYILMHKDQKKNLLELFKNIFKDPIKYSNSYLPSIPHDDDFEAFKSFAQNEKEPVGWYNCVQGHLYSIADCTQPVMESKCPTCGNKIGGLAYKITQGNVKVENLVEKQTNGYYLEEKDLTNNNPQSIRNLGVLNTVLLRILLDCTLYLATYNNTENIRQLIKSPNLNEYNLEEFFLKRIKSDIKILSECLQHSPEESLLLIHFILNRIERFNCKVKGFEMNMLQKVDRDTYEKKFCAYVKENIFNNDSTDTIIQRLNNILKNDAENSGSDQLFRIANDLINVEVNDRESEFYNQKEFWSYRKQITLNSMINSYKLFVNIENRDQFKLLDQFIERLDELKTIKYLPSIYKMLNVLHLLLNRQIDRHTSIKLKLRDLLETNYTLNMDQNLKSEVENGAKNFLKAWKLSSDYIVSKLDYKLAKNLNQNNILLKELSVSEYQELPLSFLLSNTTSEGMYIYSLIFYLINLQNEFIQFYIRTSKNKSIKEDTNYIDLEALTNSDCISFSTEKDFLRIVYIYSNYSLENSKDVNLEFDFYKIQESIEKNFIINKPLIDISGIPLIDYSDDIKDSKRFEALNRKIKQEELSFVVKDKIFSFYKQPNQLNDIIRKLNIVIDFVISSGCSYNKKIMEYAVDTLKMTNIDETIVNKQINELDLTNLKSLWDLLNLRRVILLTEHKQDPFDQLNENYKLSINMEIIDKAVQDKYDKDNQEEEKEEDNLNDHLIEHISLNKFSKLENIMKILDVIYKYIVYKLISESNNKDTEENLIDNEISIEFIFEELDSDIYSYSSIETSNFNLKGIKLKNIYHLWKLFVKIYLNNCKKI